MRKWSAIFFSILLVLSLSACGQADKDNETGNRNSQVSAEKNKNNTGSTSSNTRVLIAYFTVPEDVKTSDNDAIAGASIVVKDSEKMGNTEYVAGLVQKTIGGDLFRIETKDAYPLEHDTLVDQAAEEQEKGFFGFFKKNANKLDTMKNKYDKAEENVTKIVKALQNHQVVLMKDIAMLDKMYELNKTYFKELSMYILAGKKKLQEVRENDLKELMEKAERSGLPEDAQEAKDLDSFCNRFEKKLHDLELTRMISLQTAPQIRLVQGNDTQMVEKIQSTVVNTIPLWKSQMVLALGVEHSRQAAQSQREVTDMTNELLKKNAQTLKMATIETAKESERGIVDIETLKQTNESLISTLDEVLKIQAEGHEKRQAAEAEMQRLEGELKNKLLEIRR